MNKSLYIAWACFRNERESVNLIENIKNAQPEPMDYHRSHYYQSSPALLATNSVELNLLKQQSEKTNEHIIFRI